MTTNINESPQWADRHRQELRTRHTHEDALTEREYVRLLDGCEHLPEPRRFEARLICLLAGRLGLRGGEITHLRSEWLDWDRKLIRIPQHEPCDCGYCRRQGRQEAEHSGTLDFEQALADRWHPKTINSARIIPFDVSLRVEI